MQKKLKRWLILLLFLALVVVAGVYLFRIGLRRLDETRYPQKYNNYVEQYANEYEIDPLLIYAVIRTESGFRPGVASNVQARGLMQITEETFDWIKSKIARNEELTFDDLYVPETNIRFGAYYFSVCLNRYEGDVSTAAAAYHSGWGTVDKLKKQTEYSDNGQTLHTFPYEQMQRYVKKINNSYTKYQQIYAA